MELFISDSIQGILFYFIAFSIPIIWNVKKQLMLGPQALNVLQVYCGDGEPKNLP